jgi:hypothetical protein
MAKNDATPARSLQAFYCQGSFKLLAAKRVGFPFLDDTPPATAGAAEIREYQAIGVSGDDEFGQPSDIVSATYNP